MNQITRFSAFIFLLFFSVAVFAQSNTAFRIIGRVPGIDDRRLYQIQVGAFRSAANAERVIERLRQLSLNPQSDGFHDLIRVFIPGVGSGEVLLILNELRNAGFTEVIIRLDPVQTRTPAVRPPPSVPFSIDPSPALTEQQPPPELLTDDEILPPIILLIESTPAELPIDTELQPIPELPTGDEILPPAELPDSIEPLPSPEPPISDESLPPLDEPEDYEVEDPACPIPEEF